MPDKKKFPILGILLIPIMGFAAAFLGGLRSPGLATASLAAISEESNSYLPLIINLASPTPTLTPTATATQPPQPTYIPVPTQFSDDDWLGYINYLRYQGGLPSVSEDTSWSDGCRCIVVIWSKTIMWAMMKTL